MQTENANMRHDSLVQRLALLDILTKIQFAQLSRAGALHPSSNHDRT